MCEFCYLYRFMYNETPIYPPMMTRVCYNLITADESILPCYGAICISLNFICTSDVWLSALIQLKPHFPLQLYDDRKDLVLHDGVFSNPTMGGWRRIFVLWSCPFMISLQLLWLRTSYQVIWSLAIAACHRFRVSLFYICFTLLLLLLMKLSTGHAGTYHCLVCLSCLTF